MFLVREGEDCLLLSLLFLGNNVHKGTRDDLAGKILDLAGLELDETVHHGKEGVIFTPLDVFARVELGAPLADDDVADSGDLVAENLDSETLGNGITAEGG